MKGLVARNGKLSVAFINRKDEEYYLAEIDDVRFKTGGERTQAPDDRCPSVYRNREPGCPAWLRVRKIAPISSEEYGRLFGDFPTGDPTLYELRRENGHRIAYPLPTWDMRTVAAPGDAILHLSDLHFGSLHAYQQVPDTSGDTVRQTRLVDRIMDAVQLSSESIGVVVVSGDFVSKGWTDDYFVAEDFLRDLLERLGLGKQHLVVVPGNHDFKTLEALNAMPTMDYSHERAFRNFLKAYLDWNGPELERLQLFEMRSGEHVVFGSLNSARLRGRESKEYGYVGRHRYAEMFDFMNQSLAKSGIQARRIAVLHHHVLPVQEQEVPRDGVPISLTVDAAELFGELQERGFDAILHGHQHRPFYFRGGRSCFHTPTEVALPSRTVFVIGNGTSGAGGNALVPDFPFNSIGIHVVNSEFMRVRWYYFGPTVDPAVLSDWNVSWEER
ncbi:MAG: metallophosphoesterase [Actinobacteria bacterium]|nr:metallophosphoesterase [Actinomycetota bacterium]